MAKKIERNLIVGLDIGTSKVAAIVGEITNEGNIEIIGIGTAPSRGLKKGVVVNLNQLLTLYKKQLKKLNSWRAVRSDRFLQE
jgi:cell division protein FtsA